MNNDGRFKNNLKLFLFFGVCVIGLFWFSYQNSFASDGIGFFDFETLFAQIGKLGEGGGVNVGGDTQTLLEEQANELKNNVAQKLITSQNSKISDTQRPALVVSGGLTGALTKIFLVGGESLKRVAASAAQITTDIASGIAYENQGIIKNLKESRDQITNAVSDNFINSPKVPELNRQSSAANVVSAQQKDLVKNIIQKVKDFNTPQIFSKAETKEINTVEASAAPSATTTVSEADISRLITIISGKLAQIQQTINAQAKSAKAAPVSTNDAKINELKTLLGQLSQKQTSDQQALFNMISLTNRINSLSNVTISNPVFVSGAIKVSDIPSDIVASNYLPLGGGTLTGNLLTNSSSAIKASSTLEVTGATRLYGALTVDGSASFGSTITSGIWNGTAITDPFISSSAVWNNKISSTSLSSSATGLSYDSSTGVFSLTSGYEIPASASSTKWSDFYYTPSTRITPGTNLSWSGNTLNATGGTSISQLGQIGDVSTSTLAYGHLPMWNGTKWQDTATTSLGVILSLNGLTGSTQTFATTSNSGGFGFSSSGSIHTFNIGNASANYGGLLTATDWNTFNNKVSYTDALARAAISSSALGLTYTSGTGDFSLTSGYVIASTSRMLDLDNKVGYTDAAANSYIHASTTIPKLYSDNTFTGLNILGFATSTQFTVTGSTYLATTDGNVGVGTTSPQTKLEIVSTSSGSTQDQLFLSNLASATSTGARLTFRSNDLINATTTASIASVLTRNFWTGKADLVFSTLKSGSVTEAMRIQDNGNVGIGINNPITALTVNGNITATSSPVIATTPTVATAIDTANTAVGQYTSIAIGADGLPIISEYDATAKDLKVCKCANNSCTSATCTSIDTTGTVGLYTSIAIGADGLPVISYQDSTNSNLKACKCANNSCTSATCTTIDDTANTLGSYTSIAIGADSLPIISEIDGTGSDLRVCKCANNSCTSATCTSLDTAVSAGNQNTSIVIGTDSLPIISYQDFSTLDLRVCKCANNSCTSATCTSIDTTNRYGYSSSIAIGADGLPVISQNDDTSADLRVCKCANNSCTSATCTSIDTTNLLGTNSSMAIGTDGLPVISEYDDSTDDLRVCKCVNASCTSATCTSIDTTNAVGLYTSIAIGADGLPIISYQDSTNGDLRVARCGNAACSASGTTFSTNGSSLGGWMGNPRSSGVPYQTVNTIQIVNPTTFQNMSFLTAGSERLTITPAGNFGIGTTTPNWLLQSAGTNPFIVLSDTSAGANLKHQFLSSQDGNLYIGNATDAYATTTNITILNSGRVGVGTTNPAANLEIAQTITATGVLKGMIYTGAVNTNQTLSTEIPSLTITTAGRQWATGALTTQREILITQPTYSFVGASVITDAATVGIAGAPIKSTNATLTNTHGLLIQAGAVSTATNSFGLTVNAQTGATNNYAAAFLGGNVGVGTTTPYSKLSVWGANTNGTSLFELVNSASTSLMAVLNNGNVGIGTSTPMDKLSVVGNISVTGCVRNAATGALVTGSPACVDVAELFPTQDLLEPGDILAIDTQNSGNVKKAAISDSGKLIGVVSTNPALLIEGNRTVLSGESPTASTTPGKAAVALVGRIPVKVNIEGGEIRIGDPITISSVVGVGKKAQDSGKIVGFALENYSGPTDENGGKVLMFVSGGYWANSENTGSLSSGGPSALPAGQVGVSSSSSSSNNNNNNNNNNNPLAAVIDTVKGWLGDMKIFIEDGLVRLKNLVAGKVTTDELELRDKATKEIYCVSIVNGRFEQTPGVCDSSLSAGQAGSAQINSSGDASGGSISNSDTEPPVITLIGNNSIEIEAGISWVDPGATVTDNVNDNLGVHYKIDGIDTQDGGAQPPQIDTGNAGVHVITYTAIDAAGNTAAATRELVITDPAAQPAASGSAASVQ